jgi:hypothetical protein
MTKRSSSVLSWRPSLLDAALGRHAGLVFHAKQDLMSREVWQASGHGVGLGAGRDSVLPSLGSRCRAAGAAPWVLNLHFKRSAYII